MAIVELIKVTLIGKTEEKSSVLDGLQHLGILHLIPLTTKVTGVANEELPAKTVDAVRYLEQAQHRLKPRLLDGKIAPLTEVSAVVDEVLQHRRKSRQHQDKRDELLAFVRIRSEWGDFEFPSVEDMAGMRFWFYEVPRSQMRFMDASGLPYEVIKEKHGVVYTIVLSASEPARSVLPMKRVRTGVVSLKSLKQRLYDVEQELEELQLKKMALTRWLPALTDSLTASLEQADRTVAEQGVSDDGDVFCVSGWLPLSNLDDLYSYASGIGLVVVEEPVKDKDNPPTLLHSKPWYEGAQRIIEFFQMPGYRDWDPSVSIFFSFCLFYSMILSDAGYALVMLCGLFAFQKKFKKTRRGLAMYRMALSMGGCALLWGVVVGSYFGVSPQPESILGGFALIDLTDFDTMIRFSVGVGVAHLVLANTSAAFYSVKSLRGKLSALSYMGWATVFVSGYLLWLADLNVISGDGVKWLIYALLGVGVASVFLFSSDRGVFNVKTLVLRILDGLKAMMGLSKGFGDALSYMRLFALGLSSAQLAVTFNTIAFDMLDVVPGIGVFFCVLILIAGHLLNLVLGVMGGVIHGLRLNLIEFFHWGIHDEGYLFKPFSKREDESWKR